MLQRLNKLFQRYIPSRSVSRQAVFVVIGDGITTLSTLAAGMILARLMPVDQLAIYRQIAYIGPMAVAFAEFGISSSIYRFYAYYPEERREAFLRWVAWISIILGTLATFVLVILSEPLSFWYKSPGLASALMITASYPLTLLPFMLVRSLWISQGKSLSATMLETIFAVLTALALILPSLWKLPFLQIMMIWMVINWLRIPVVIIAFREVLFRRPWWSPQILQDVWGYLWPIQVGRITGLFTIYFDKILTSVMFSPASFAAYSFGARELPFIGGIGASISNVLIPKMVDAYQKDDIDQLCAYWNRTIRSTARFTYIIGAFCVWHATPIVIFLFSATYVESSYPFRAFAALTFIRVIEYSSMAKAIGRSDLIMKASFYTTILYAFILLFLTMWGGIVGISWGLFLAAWISVFYFLWQYSHILNRPVASFFPIQPLLVDALLSFAGVAMADWLLKPFIHLAAEAGFLALLVKLGVLFMLSAGCYALFVYVERFIMRKYFKEMV